MTELPNPPNVETFDELREALLEEAKELDDLMREHIKNVEHDGRREDVADAINELAGRISATQTYFIASLTDEQLATIMPDWHPLVQEDE